MTSTPHARTADALLRTKGVTLEEFIATRREVGLSYDRISRALAEFTDAAVAVTAQTIRNWATDLGIDTQESAEVAS